MPIPASRELDRYEALLNGCLAYLLGYTARLFALSGDMAESAVLLIERGADVYVQARSGETVLIFSRKGRKYQGHRVVAYI